MSTPPPIVVVEDWIAALVPRFLANRRKDLDLMAAAIAARDFGALAAIGHRLKGDAAGYGFTGIAAIAARIETAARTANLELARLCAREMALYIATVKVVHR